MPEELGGAGESRSPMTNVLVAEDLAYGDMALAMAALAPVSVVHALVDYGTAEQQGEYLPVFAGEEFYPAAIALLESRPLFDPHRLSTRATLQGGSYVLSGEKTMVPLAEDAELFLVLADLAGKPQAFLVEKGTPGLSVEPEPTMGLRGAKLGRLKLEQVRRAAQGQAGRRRRHRRRAPDRPLARSRGARWRSAPATPCSTTSSRTATSASRSASRSPIASRSRS